eukprot:UN31980
MKISEMPNYDISIFERFLDVNLKYLSEKDFVTLVGSYWCTSAHFESMVNRRGSEIEKGKVLELNITQDILNLTVEAGPNVDKLKSMLKQRRKDVNNQNKSRELDFQFFHRNWPRKFISYEAPIRAFAENGWLSKSLAKIGLSRFAMFINDKSSRNVKSTSSTNRKWCNLIELLSSNGATINEEELPLMVRESYIRGCMTFKFKTMSTAEKNDNTEIRLCSDIWRTLCDFL